MHRLLVNYSRPWDSQSEYCGDNYQDASKWHYRVANATHRAMDPQISPINTDLRPVAQCGSVEFARGMQCDDTPCSARRNGHYRIANTTHRGMDPQISPINTDLRPVAQCGSVEFAAECKVIKGRVPPVGTAITESPTQSTAEWIHRFHRLTQIYVP